MKTNLLYTVGIDVSADKLDVHLERRILSDQITYQKVGSSVFPNTSAGFGKLIRWVNKLKKSDDLLQFVMEATGRYHEPLAYYLHENRYRLSIVLPNRVKNFSRSFNQFSKNDQIDAFIIARFGNVCQPKNWQPACPTMRQLKELTRERADYKQTKTAYTNRLKALRKGGKPPRKTIARIEEVIEQLKLQIEMVENDIVNLKHSDEYLKSQVELLTSIPHIGEITACSLLAETNGFILFENRNQLIKYAGLDIVERQSGSSIRGKTRLSKRGNSRIRECLYMPALSACGRDSVFSETYRKQIQKTGIHHKAIMAVMRKLLLVAYQIHQTKQTYCDKIHRGDRSKKIDSPKAAYSS